MRCRALKPCRDYELEENIINSNDSGPVALKLAISSGKLQPQPLMPVMLSRSDGFRTAHF